ncbi:MAG: radical SAM family heme chaperone HemW [Tissierellaceae bacterium]|nr:radical SAM family heme chaperone HemW [Tissierellaceae bacterium]
MQDISLYIHIPFCASKCHYCDFSSFSGIEDRIPLYVNSLIAEIDLYRQKLENYNVKTIFIGGGTPSHIEAKYIYRILGHIYENYNAQNVKEITIEVNPGTVNKEKSRIYKELGINRVSMGAQSFNDSLLRKIGRIHNAKDIFSSYKILSQIGIENINLDLIFGLPEQTLNDVLKSTKMAVELGAHHISHYGLIIEEGTKFYEYHKNGRLYLPDEDLEREMYHRATEYLVGQGYKHYEISNYSLKGYECKHNIVYWDIEPYIGLGLSSHSFMEGRRFFNTSDFSSYIDLLKDNILPVDGEEIVDVNGELEDYCIFGLRKIDGIDKEKFYSRFGINIEELYGEALTKHIKGGLLVDCGQFIKLTKKGLDLSNLVEIDFIK